MARESRLDHIYSGLTALERARLVLQTYHDGTRENPAWRMTMPRRQGEAFNQYIYIMNAANMHVAWMIGSLEADLQLLWERYYRFTYIIDWYGDIRYDAPSARREAQRRAQDPDAVSVAERRAELEYDMEALAQNVVTGVGNLWQSMRGVEVGLEEMTAQFDGTDPLKPHNRQRLNKVRHDLTELVEHLEEFDWQIERREPDEEMLRLMRSTVLAMRATMGF